MTFAPPEPSMPRRLSRTTAAARLEISPRTLSRLEHEGRISAIRDDQGRVWFDGDAIEELALERTHARPPDDEGARAQRAFGILRADGDARRLVEELAVAPAEARRLFDAWSELGDCVVVEPAQARRIAALVGAAHFDPVVLERVLVGTSRLARALSAPCEACGQSHPQERWRTLEAKWTCQECAEES